MPSIEIRREHGKTIEDARAAVERVANKIAERFDVEYGWDGNTLHFKRSGVDGRIALQPGAVHVTATLGMLFSAMKGTIESELRRVLQERLP